MNSTESFPVPADLPRTIFTISTGRCGTDFLCRLLGRLDSVHCEHEPAPNFVDVMRAAQTNPGAATDFLVKQKLPAIAATGAKTYVETSHLFGKGFFEPLFDLGIIPDAIFLSRGHREVAQSMQRIGCIPHRTESGQQYLLEPEDPDVLPCDDWQNLTDYQLCYWYCLETARRSQSYREFLRRFDKKIPRICLRDLRTWQGFRDMLMQLGLELPSRWSKLSWQKALQTPTNKKSHFAENADALSADEFAQQEAGVAEQVTIGQRKREQREQAVLQSSLEQAGANISQDAVKAAAAELSESHTRYLNGVSTEDMAVSLELAAFLLVLCRVKQPNRVLDLGSGYSSFVLRKYAAERGDVHVASVDDDAAWLQRTVGWISVHELGTAGLDEWQAFKVRLGSEDPYDVVLYDMGSMATRIQELRTVLGGTTHDKSLVILDDVHKPDYEQYARYVCRSLGLTWADTSYFTRDSLNRHSALVMK